MPGEIILIARIHRPKRCRFDHGWAAAAGYSEIAPSIGNESQVERLIQESIPCVVINKKADNFKISYVAIDNEKGAWEATNFLIELGHKRIAHITGDMNTQCAQERLSGFKKALSKAGVDIPEYFIQEGKFSRAQARRSVDFLFVKDIKPTAIFCASDDMAYEAILYLLEKLLSTLQLVT